LGGGGLGVGVLGWVVVVCGGANTPKQTDKSKDSPMRLTRCSRQDPTPEPALYFEV